MFIVYLIVACVAGILPMLAYLIFIYWLDRYEREPWWLVGLVFLWGGIGGAVFGCVINTTIIAAIGAIFGPEEASWMGPVIVAPLVEEVTKIIPLFGLIFLRHFDNATDGLIYGAACGLGFAMTENIYYFYNVGSSLGFMAMLHNIFVRTCFTAMVHCAASASWGFFLGIGRYRPPIVRWLIVPPLGYAAAIAIHAFWNGSATHAAMKGSQELQLGAYVVIVLVGILMFALTQASLFLEHQTIKRGLAEEVASGLIPASHLDVLPFWLKRIQKGWLRPGVDKDRYIRAATLLAFRKDQARHAVGQTKEGLLDDVARYREEVKMLLAQAPPAPKGGVGGWGGGWGRPEAALIRDSAALSTIPNNLSAPHGPFLGRKHHLDLLDDAWTQRKDVLLAGLPGVGKTRLAQEAAARLVRSESTAGGVWFVDVRGARTPAALELAILGAMGAQAVNAASVVDALGRVGACLLVLDGCEGLDNGALEALAQWRRESPHAQWWLTSRRRIEQSGFDVWHLGGLAVPKEGDKPEAQRQNAAVSLMISLVSWRRGHYAPTDADVALLSALTRTLGGLPLALKLAAGRMTLLTPAQVLERTRSSMSFLRVQGSEPQGLDAVLHEVTSALTEPQRRTWAGCSVFRGGFDAVAAEAVLGQPDVLDHLEVLERRFLLSLDPHVQPPRLTVVQPAQRFAEMHLQALGERDEHIHRHLEYYAPIAFEKSRLLPGDHGAMAWLLKERDNLKAVLERSAAHPDPLSRSQILALVHAVLSLTNAQRFSGEQLLSKDSLGDALERVRSSEGLEARAMGYLVHSYAVERRRAGDDAAFLRFNDEALQVVADVEDDFLKAAIWNSRAVFLFEARDCTGAARAYERALEYLEAPRWALTRSRLMGNLSALDLRLGQGHKALARLEEAIPILEAHGVGHSIVKAHVNLGLALKMVGRPLAGLASVERAVALARERDNPSEISECIQIQLDQRGQLVDYGGMSDAELDALLDEALRLGESHGSQLQRAWINYNRVAILLSRGQHSEAGGVMAVLESGVEEGGGELQSGVRLITAMGMWSSNRLDEALELLSEGVDNAMASETWRSAVEMSGMALCVAASLGEDEHTARLEAQAEDLLSRVDAPASEAFIGMGQAAVAVGALRRAEAERGLDEALLSKAVDSLAPLLAPLAPDEVSIMESSIGLRLMAERVVGRLTLPERAILWARASDPHCLRLVVARGGSGFHTPGGTWVALAHHPVQIRLLGLLCAHPEGLSTSELIEGLYPDEQIVYEAGVNRVHKTLSLLRSAGLRGFIERGNGRYKLSSAALLVPPDGNLTQDKQ